jgi:hypothetical protein
MALIAPAGISADLIRRAEEAAEFLRETGEFYREMTRVARAEGEDNPARARDRLHEYRKAAMVALEEGRRVADEINRARGIHRDYALDLEAARLEVERLLDRLAAEIGAGEVS